MSVWRSGICETLHTRLSSVWKWERVDEKKVIRSLWYNGSGSGHPLRRQTWRWIQRLEKLHPVRGGELCGTNQTSCHTTFVLILCINYRAPPIPRVNTWDDDTCAKKIQVRLCSLLAGIQRFRLVCETILHIGGQVGGRQVGSSEVFSGHWWADRRIDR